ncbi:MAG: hypothetical protein ACREBW_06890 [Candidatus Micrarchaeaceae archaeon]
MFPSTLPAIEPFLLDYMSEVPVRAHEFFNLLQKPLRAFCARKAFDLPLDVRDEVLSEMLLLLKSPGRASFDPSRGSAESFVYFAAKSALKNVRADYGRKVIVCGDENDVSTEAEILALDDEFPDPKTSESKLHLVIRSKQVLSRVDESMRSLLSRIYLDGEEQGSVLSEAGLDRFTFNRRCRQIGREIAALGRCA